MDKLSFMDSSRQQLTKYLSLLEKWQKAVNLVAPSTLTDAWNRHIVDSAQLFPHIPLDASILADMGSGAGFPGLVLAVLNQNNQGPLKKIILIESDSKKCLFLKEVARQMGVQVTILNQRLESVSGFQADVVTARALAPFPQLLKWGKTFITPQTTCLFLKGENEQLNPDGLTVNCRLEKIKSVTNSKSFIVKATEIIYE